MNEKLSNELLKDISKRTWGIAGNSTPTEEALMAAELLTLRASQSRETEQFNDGYHAAKSGEPETNEPHYEINEDQWCVGYAWGMYDKLRADAETSQNHNASVIDRIVAQLREAGCTGTLSEMVTEAIARARGDYNGL
jgi:hypothetical protein